MSSCSVNGSDKETNTVGSLGGVAGLHLSLLLDFRYKTLSRVLTSVSVPVAEALIAHELGQVAGVSSHTRNADTHVFVNLEDLFLMEGQIVRTLFQPD